MKFSVHKASILRKLHSLSPRRAPAPSEVPPGWQQPRPHTHAQTKPLGFVALLSDTRRKAVKAPLPFNFSSHTAAEAIARERSGLLSTRVPLLDTNREFPLGNGLALSAHGGESFYRPERGRTSGRTEEAGNRRGERRQREATPPSASPHLRPCPESSRGARAGSAPRPRLG